MSYVLHVWETPLRATLEEADRIDRSVARQYGRQNPKFIEFARRLAKRFPMATTRAMANPAHESEGLDKKQDLVTIVQDVLTPLILPHGFKSLKRWSDTDAPYKRRFKDFDKVADQSGFPRIPGERTWAIICKLSSVTEARQWTQKVADLVVGAIIPIAKIAQMLPERQA